MADAPPTAIGVATLSLNNLQGPLKLWKGGVWPLHDIRPDPERGAALAFPHRGAVTGLVDADMKPLRGPRDTKTGEFLGLPVVDRRGGPIVMREIGTAERAEICAQLLVQAWRGAGCRRVSALRPRMGQDFNDAVREMVDV
jgi:DNA primase